MDWLGGWLRSLIMVILLATFVDLLLPSSTMQRYVKTVMSLLILVTLLSPVLQLFQKKWSVDSMITAVEYKQNTMNRAQESRKPFALTSLEDITTEANKLKTAGEQQSQKLLQSQLAAMIKEDLQKQTNLHVDDVQVTSQIDNNGKPDITDVRVSLHEIEKQDEKGKQDGRSIAAMAPVQPILPVQIQITPTHESVQAISPLSELSPAMQQEKQKLIQIISRDWMVQSEHIDVRILSSLPVKHP
jgi:stage III sporulation protein AF